MLEKLRSMFKKPETDDSSAAMPESTRGARLIAHYLPQFHPIPENDEWWGKGFTEWTNVTKAKPLFEGHYQPILPADLGFYDLRVPEVRAAQAELARQCGIEAFCYWHYWFAGKRILERPFNEVLKSGEPDFPFCLGWGNDSWTGIWHGCEDRLLIEQTYPGAKDEEAHFYELLPAFQDKRYLKVEGKPLFLIYKPYMLPEPNRFLDHWRELAVKEGLPGIYFVGNARTIDWRYEVDGFDAMTPHNPGLTTYHIFLPHEGLKRRFWDIRFPGKSFSSAYIKYFPGPDIILYEDYIKIGLPELRREMDEFPCVLPNWDNTARCGMRGQVFLDPTPELFGQHLREAIEQVAHRPPEKRLIFVKSWNEWAEGNYMEPDMKYGHGYLEACRAEVFREGR
jgi:Glycosyltransferase WbsX